MEKFNDSKYKNQFAKDNYDRLNIQVKKGTKAKIEEHRKNKGFKSLNDYVTALIYNDMKCEKVVIHAETIEQNGDNNTINIG